MIGGPRIAGPRALRRAPGEDVTGLPTSPWAIPIPLALVLLAAAIFRAVYFSLYARTSIFFDGLILDSSVYDAWARAIASGRVIGTEAFYFPPLYPYLLGIVFRLFGPSYAVVYLLQALMGLANIALVHRIGSAVFNPRVGLIAACGAALYAPFPFFEMKVMGTTLGVTLNLAALLLLVRAESVVSRAGERFPAHWFAAGLLIGVAALVLPGTILLALLYAGTKARRHPRVTVAILAGAFLGLLPALIHNLYVAADPLPLSGQGGITFYQGNNPKSAGLYDVAPGFSGSPETQAEEERAIAERETGHALRRSQISAHFFRKGLAFITGSPGRWLWLEARKLLALLGDYEASTEYSLYLERDQIPWLWLAFLPYAAIAGAGVAGLLGPARSERGGEAPVRDGAGQALPIYTIYAAAIPILFYVSSRYRLPLVPALVIYGASFVERAAWCLREGGARRVAAERLIVLAALVGLVSLVPLGTRSATAEANVHYNIGNVLADRGRHEEAIVSFDRALAGWPDHAFALINRGNSLDRLGREEEALASYRRAEEVRPGLWKAYKAQGVVLHRQKRFEEEAEAYRRGLPAGGAEARFLLGTILKRLDRLDEAATALQDAIRLDPGYARAHSRLGEIYALRGDVAHAKEQFRKALEADPADATARAGLDRLGG
jgi:tetratricopeptide (TPR) repeat protein